MLSLNVGSHKKVHFRGCPFISSADERGVGPPKVSDLRIFFEENSDLSGREGWYRRKIQT